MIPIYTRFLSPYDYGILELIAITLNILSIVLAGGLTEAVSRFYFDYQETKDRNKVISVGLITFIVLAIVSFALLAPFSSLMSETLLDTPEYSSFFLIAIAYMGLSLILQLIFAYFRVTQRSISLTVASLAGLVVSLGLNIYFVVVLEIGVKGILLATLITLALQVAVLIPMTFKSVGYRFDLSLLNDMFRFGFPIIFTQISHQIVTVSDRYFIKAFYNLTDTGLYSLAYKMGALVITFVGTPFDMIFKPRRFEYFGQEEAEKNFARIFTLFIFVITLVGMYISILIRDILRLLVTEPFWDAYKIVPIIVLTYVFYSFFYHFNVGILMKKKTKLYAGINIATGVLNLILNYFLIKAYSIWGAAVATLICYVFRSALTYYFSNRIHPIIMETRNIILIFACAFVTYGLCSLIETGDTYMNLILKSLAGLIYVLSLYLMGLFTHEEIQTLKEFTQTQLSRIGLGSR